MKKQILFLFLLFFLGKANAQLTSGEYFFDTAPAVGGGTAFSFTSANNINQTLSMPIASLSNGFHNVFIRVKDGVNTWSHYEGRTFFIIPNPATASQLQLVSGEWFLNNDPGVGNGTAITFSQANNINIAIALNNVALVSGFNNLFVRVKDVQGTWSHYEGRTFYVIPAPTPASQLQLTAGEWFLNTDPGVGNGTAIAFAQGNTVNSTIALNNAALVSGFHNLFIRVKDITNTWSHYEGRTFYVIPTNTNQVQPQLVGGEWFIDSDPGLGNGNAINFAAANSVNPIIAIPSGTLSIGTHHLFIRVKDANGVWSHYEGRQFTNDPLGVQSNALKIINLYPNPTNSMLNIDMEQFISSVRIVDIVGKTSSLALDGSKAIDVSSLANGVYFIEIKTDEGFYRERFIKN